MVMAVPSFGIIFFRLITQRINNFYPGKPMKHLLKRFEVRVLAVAGAGVILAGFLMWNPKTVPTRIDPVVLPVKDSVVRVSGTGQSALSVFESPDCGFCVKLAPRLAVLKNVTLRRYVLPGHSVVSRKAAIASVCESQPGGPLADDCAVGAAIIDRNLALARSLGIPSTPAIIFGNGDVHIGLIETHQLERGLAQK